jgi:hypothetical protein
MLCGCASSAKRELPAPLQVDLGALAKCEQLLGPVPLPAVTAKTDARAAFVRDEAALLAANGRLGAGRSCVADVRRAYGGARDR